MGCAVIGYCSAASSYDWSSCDSVLSVCLSGALSGNRKQEVDRKVLTDLEQAGGELLQLLAKLVSDFRQPLTLLILQQQLLTHKRANTHRHTQKTPQNKNAK